MECPSCHQFVNACYLKRHEQTAKCSKQRNKEATKTTTDKTESTNCGSDPNKIPCKFCGQEVSPKSMRKHESSAKCWRLRKGEPEKRKRENENEDSTSSSKKSKSSA